MIIDTKDAGQEFPARDSRVLDNEILTTKGATSDIIRQTFFSGETVIVKKAKKPEYNPLLRSEYVILKELNADHEAPKSIPKVYADFSPKDANVDAYAFQEENLTRYSPLLDRDGKNTAILEGLSWRTRLIILGRICWCMSYLSSKGLIHNDLQLSNILFQERNMDVKIIDWAGCQRVAKETAFTDVTQLTAMIPLLFLPIVIPRPVEDWIAKVKKNKFLTSQDAWNALDFAINSSLDS